MDRQVHLTGNSYYRSHFSNEPLLCTTVDRRNIMWNFYDYITAAPLTPALLRFRFIKFCFYCVILSDCNYLLLLGFSKLQFPIQLGH